MAGACLSCGSAPCEELPGCKQPTAWPTKRRGDIPTCRERVALAKAILDDLKKKATPVVDESCSLS